MDGNIPQHYEVKQEQLWGVINPQEQLNRLQEEYRKSVIQGMDDDLRSGWKYEEIKHDLKYDVVWNIWIIIYKWEPYAWYKYSKEKWVEYYTNVEWLEKNEDLPFWERTSWYELNNWELFKKWQKITQFLENWNINSDFVKGVDSINFYTDLQLVFWLMKGVIDWDKIRFSIKWMNSTIISWVMRIKDIVYFAWNRDKISVDEKWTKLTDEDIKKLLQRAILELPNQCSDTRFYQTAQWVRMWMEVTKEELDEYLKPTEWAALITQSLYDECLRRIEVRDKKIAEMTWVKETSKVERKIENERIGVLEWVKWILGDLF
jgi:hypothetical protein